MNESGNSAGPARGALGVDLDRVVVIHDEIDLPFGARRGPPRRRPGRPQRPEVAEAAGSAARTSTASGWAWGARTRPIPEIVSAWVLGRFREPPDEVRALVESSADELERLIS